MCSCSTKEQVSLAIEAEVGER